VGYSSENHGMDLQLQTAMPDGRTLDVYVDGPEGAVPLLFHNGTPSAGQLYAPFVAEASRRGLRMVSFSRPGYENSTRNPGRSVADVMPDVAGVMDHVGAHRFYTLGWSGGGPHALACAALLPARVIGVATVGGLAPYDAEGLDWMAGRDQGNIATFGAALAGDAALRTFLEGVAPSFASVTPTRSRRGSATWSRTSTARRSLARPRPGWRMSPGSQCGPGSGAGMTMRLPLWGRGASTSLTSKSQWRFGRGRRIG
jgi:pimeloyl-ACP methyl ester carboxylesterase